MSEENRPRPRVAGWGTDLASERRPGVPHAGERPEPIGNPHWREPERQVSAGEPPLSVTRDLTPVFSSAEPPQGLSGVLRRAAYRIPEYKNRRWALLMFADRVDVAEYRLRWLLRRKKGFSPVGA